MQQTTRLKVSELNDQLICVLCGGYLIDATALTECLHSFCRTCIVRHFEKSKSCPKCGSLVHKTRPLLNVRPDRTLQTLVYKLVPGLFQNEMQRRMQFYKTNPNAVATSGEDRGEMEDNHLIYTEDEKISLCLQHCDRFPSATTVSKFDPTPPEQAASPDKKDSNQRYLLCPALLTIGHLKKFVRHKFDLPSLYQVEIFHTRDSLKDACTLMDVANIYSWKRVQPLRLFYLVFDASQLSLELPEPTDRPIITTTVRIPRPLKTQNGTKPRKSSSGSKSPKNGLVKSRRFKPPVTATQDNSQLDGDDKDTAAGGIPASQASQGDKIDKSLSLLQRILKKGSKPADSSASSDLQPGQDKACVSDNLSVKQEEGDVKLSEVRGQQAADDDGGETTEGYESSDTEKPSEPSSQKILEDNTLGKTNTVVVRLPKKKKKKTKDAKVKPLRVPPVKITKSPLKVKTKCSSNILRGNEKKSTAKWLNMLELKAKEDKSHKKTVLKSTKPAEKDKVTKDCAKALPEQDKKVEVNVEKKIPSPQIPSPTPEPIILDTIKDSDDQVTVILDNQPDLVLSNQCVTLPCSNCGHKKVTEDDKTDTKVAKDGQFCKSRSDVVMRAADTSNPELLAEDSKPDNTHSAADTCPEPMDTDDASSSPKSDAMDAVNRASPASSICSLTIGQSGITTEETSRSPTSDHGSSQDKPPTDAKPVVTVSRPRKTPGTVRDKAKSINSIIKRIEERNHGLQQAKTFESPSPVSTPPKPDSADRTTPTTPLSATTGPPRKLISPPVNSAPIPPQGYATVLAAKDKTPTSPVKQQQHLAAPRQLEQNQLTQGNLLQGYLTKGRGQLAQGPVRPGLTVPVPAAPKRANSGRGRGKRSQSPAGAGDTTPIKRLRQMCNGFSESPGTKKASGPRGKQFPNPNLPLANQMAAFRRQQQQQQRTLQQQQQQQQQQQRGSFPRPVPNQGQLPGQHALPSPRPLNNPTTAMSLERRGHQPAKVFVGSPPPPPSPLHYPPAPAHSHLLPQQTSPSNVPAHTNMRPAHNNYKAGGFAYQDFNPRANGYDEPLELTTKPSRDRSQHEPAQGQGRGQGRGTFLKIPSVVKH